MQRRTKYGAKKTEYEGRKYDSKLEASVAHELEMLQRAGEIKEVKPQHTFELVVAGHVICRHRVDFLCRMPDDSLMVVEAKGYATSEWAIKRNLFCALFPHIPYEVRTARSRWPKRKLSA